MRPGSLDLFQRYWMAVLVYIGIALLLHYSLSAKSNFRKRKQALIITIGMIIPSIQGVLTQVIFPLLELEQIPVTSTSITFLSGAIIIALTRYKLFNISESIHTEKVLNNLTIPVFCVSIDREIIYSNSAFKNRFGVNNRKPRMEITDLFINKKDYDFFLSRFLAESKKYL